MFLNCFEIRHFFLSNVATSGSHETIQRNNFVGELFLRGCLDLFPLQGRSITRKRTSEGREQTLETLHNLQEGN